MTDYEAMGAEFVEVNGKQWLSLDLAEMVGVGNPSSRESAGGKWLLAVARAYLDDRDEIRESDDPNSLLFELAGNKVPTGSWAQWQVFVDLRLWDYDSEFTFNGITTHQLIPGMSYEMGQQYKREPDAACTILTHESLPALPEAFLHEIASNLLGIIFHEDAPIPDADDDDDEDDEDDDTDAEDED